jgi:hypothetical protein
MVSTMAIAAVAAAAAAAITSLRHLWLLLASWVVLVLLLQLHF